MIFAVLAAASLLDLSGAAATPPPPWKLSVKAGRPLLRLSADGTRGICLDSDASSFSIQRRTDIDLTRTPVLHVRWRVDALPPNGDFRTAKDDQAAQFFVAFATPFRYRAINYIWDTTAPVGATGDYDVLWFIRVKTLTVKSGASDAGRWVELIRNVRRDYEQVFGGTAPAVKGIRFQVNSQYTKSHAVGCLAAAFFASE